MQQFSPIKTQSVYIYQSGKQWKLQEVFALLEKRNFKKQNQTNTKPPPKRSLGCSYGMWTISLNAALQIETLFPIST